MNKKSLLSNPLLFFLLLMLTFSSLDAQWRVLNPLSSSDVNSIVGRGSEVYASSYGKGIYLSTDNGGSWKLYNQGLLGLEVTCLLSTGSDIFAGTFYNGLYKLNGRSWSPVNVCDEVTVHALGFCGSVIYAGINNSIYSSSDYGTTWTKIHDFDKGVYVTSFAFYCCGAYAGTNTAGVFVYSSGSGWTLINKGIIPNINCLTVHKQVLYAGTKTGTFYQDVVNTTDSSWSYLGGPAVSVTSLLFFKDNLLVGTDGFGLFLYKNSGWTGVYSSLNNKSIMALYNSANTLFAGTKQFGIYRSTDEGVTWSVSSTGIVQNSIRDLLVDNDKIIILNSNDGSINQTSDFGSTWTAINSGIKNKTGLYYLAKFGDQIYTGGLNGLYKTNSSVISWKTTGLFSTTKSLLVDNQNYFSGGTDDNGKTIISCSSDSGRHWNQSYVNSIGFVNQFFKIGNRILAAHQTLGVIESDDNGATWFENNAGLKYADPVTAWKITSAGSYLFASTQNGLYRSDINSNWLFWQQVIDFGKNVYDMVDTGNKLFIAVYGGGVFSSNDYGSTWNNISEGLTDSSIIAIKVSNSDLYCASSGGGIYYRPLSELGIVSDVDKNNNIIPNDFSVSQNYPNPFNPATVINYRIPKGSFVTIKIYDLLGRQISSLVDKYQDAGNYSVTLDSRSVPGFQSLSNGIYFYQFNAKQFHKTMKMILMK